MPNFEHDCGEGDCPQCGIFLMPIGPPGPVHKKWCTYEEDRKPKRGPAQHPCGLFHIPVKDVKGQIGNIVHVTWAGKGPHWILEDVIGDRALLCTPKSGKRLRVFTNQLLYARRHQPKECNRV